MRPISLSDAGKCATLAKPESVAVVRARDGALAVCASGASSTPIAPDQRLVVGGEWGLALIVPVEETA